MHHGSTREGVLSGVRPPSRVASLILLGHYKCKSNLSIPIPGAFQGFISSMLCLNAERNPQKSRPRLLHRLKAHRWCRRGRQAEKPPSSSTVTAGVTPAGWPHIKAGGVSQAPKLQAPCRCVYSWADSGQGTAGWRVGLPPTVLKQRSPRTVRGLGPAPPRRCHLDGALFLSSLSCPGQRGSLG